jgi:Gram-negative bacterial TonB protein C-terminal
MACAEFELLNGDAFMKTNLMVVILFVATLFSAQLKAQSDSAWKEYNSEKGKFSILFPGEPKLGYRPVGTDSDTSITSVSNLIIDQKAWTVAYFDLPRPTGSEAELKQLFDQTRDRILKMYSRELNEEVNLKTAKFSAREFRAKPDNRDRVFICRLVLVGQRVYEVWTLTERKFISSSDIPKFFDSFKPVSLTDEEIKTVAQNEKELIAKAPPMKQRVSSGVLLGKAIKKVQPETPKEGGISGTVQVEIAISEEGQVIKAEALNGHPILRPLAEAAALQWVFPVTTISGRPTIVLGILPFEFKRK